MTQHARATAQQQLGARLVDGDVLHLAARHQRAHLQEAEFVRLRRVTTQAHRELDLGGAAQPPAAHAEQHIEHCRQREQALLEDGSERHQSHAAPRQAIVDGHVLLRPRRAQRGERAVRLRGLESEARFAQRRLVVRDPGMIQLQRPELALRVAQDVLGR